MHSWEHAYVYSFLVIPQDIELISCCCCSVVYSCVQLFATTWTAARQASLSFTVSWSLLKLMSIELVIPSPSSPKARVTIFSSVQFSCSVMSNYLWPHGLQHARLSCPSPTPRVYSNSCPLSWWCHPTISSSVVPFSHLQSFPASGSFQMSQFFTSGGQSIGVSSSTSVLPVNTQDWSPLG